MARAVSGGAVYVSDKPGQHDFSLLRRLVLPDGAVLRGLLPGRPTRDCLFVDVLRDKQTLLKVRWNITPLVGVAGVLNLQGLSCDTTYIMNEPLLACLPSSLIMSHFSVCVVYIGLEQQWGDWCGWCVQPSRLVRRYILHHQ